MSAQPKFKAGDIIVHTSPSQKGIEREIVDVIYDLETRTQVVGYLWTYPDLNPADTHDNQWDSRKSSDPLMFWWTKRS